MQLGDLIQGLDVTLASNPSRLPSTWHTTRVCDLTEDSRTIVPSSLFIARAGIKSDGKAFIADALAAGASAILSDAPIDPSYLAHDVHSTVPILITRDIAHVVSVIAERFYGDPSRSLSIMGVTGTNGKTTIAHLVWRIMNASTNRTGMIGTVQIDDGSEVAPAMMTTPPAIEVSRTLSVMVESGCKAASMEVSSHSLDQKRVEALRFAVGVFTNLTGDHLDYHKTMDAYAAAKARLFELLPADALAIVNTQDPWAARMVRNCKARIIACQLLPRLLQGRDSPAPTSTCNIAQNPANSNTHTATHSSSHTASVRILRSSMAGMLLELHGHFGEITCDVPLIGEYNAMNVLQAVISCHALGLHGDALRDSLAAITAPPGRLERVSQWHDSAIRSREGVHVFVDYAHSDDSLTNVLRAVSQELQGNRARSGSSIAHGVIDAAGAAVPGDTPPRLWVVFGCGGDRDRTKRPRMGLAAVTLADRVVVTSDNPRRERPSAIVDEILIGIPIEHRYKVDVHVERDHAIRFAIEHATPGDVIVIAGKGHETEQIISDGQGGTIKTHFDDREVARTILLQLHGSTHSRSTNLHSNAASPQHATTDFEHDEIDDDTFADAFADLNTNLYDPIRVTPTHQSGGSHMNETNSNETNSNDPDSDSCESKPQDVSVFPGRSGPNSSNPNSSNPNSPGPNSPGLDSPGSDSHISQPHDSSPRSPLSPRPSNTPPGRNDSTHRGDRGWGAHGDHL